MDESTTTEPAPTSEPGPRRDPLPAVAPTPQRIAWLGADATVPRRVTLATGDTTDDPTRDLLTRTLRAAGARRVEEAEGNDDELVVRVGGLGDRGVADALRAAGVEPPTELPAEGYALAVKPGSVVVAGADGDGVYYGAQTLRQLVQGDSISGVSVVDHPAMPRRGVVEGFYGSPWTVEERLDQLAFYGDLKLNTYVYAPKDDPYHRERWREPYPAEELAGLRRLVDAARTHHVRFTFAISPGGWICYSDPADVAALEAKFAVLHDHGVRDFAIALDDIDYGRWNCDGDQARYGDPTPGAAGRAHADLLNTVQQGFVAGHPGTRPLVLVPTEYQGVDDSPYRQALRERLDPAIEVMWTGRFVVPAEITGAQAEQAGTRFGRPLLLWDNYPVNDYPRTAGRLLLAPYARRTADLDQHLTGVIANPMNQAAASKVALVGVADFSWNPPAYDPARAWRAAAGYLATGGLGSPPPPAPASTPRDGATSGDAGGADRDGPRSDETVEALLAFFDLEHFVPTSARSESVIGQPQAPALSARLDAFRSRWASGDRAGAVAELRPYAELLAAAPDRIRTGVGDAGFLADCQPWLDALGLWGRAFAHALGGLDARLRGDASAADRHFAEAGNLAAQASAIHTVPGETLPQGPVKVGDGVLDAFLAEAPALG